MSKLPVQSCRLYVTSELAKEAPNRSSEPALCSQVPSRFKLVFGVKNVIVGASLTGVTVKVKVVESFNVPSEA